MDILDLLTNKLDDNTLKQLSKSVNAKPDQVKKLTQIGIPTLIEALNRNSNTPQGAQALNGALERHKDDKVDDLSDFLQKVDKDDGAKILKHVLGGKNQAIQTNLAKQSGMDTSQVMGLLSTLAPLILGALGNKKKQDNLDASGVSGLTSMLAGALGKSGGSDLMGMASKLLDADRDGNIMDDLGNMLGGFFKK
ncbi:MAG: DUF937 domain-containing protein [Eubacteriaceae bacterium]|nr:DUF937 domain-containing protein [Eubacteriaceae bacterium]